MGVQYNAIWFFGFFHYFNPQEFCILIRNKTQTTVTNVKLNKRIVKIEFHSLNVSYVSTYSTSSEVNVSL